MNNSIDNSSHVQNVLPKYKSLSKNKRLAQIGNKYAIQIKELLKSKPEDQKIIDFLNNQLNNDILWNKVNSYFHKDVQTIIIKKADSIKSDIHFNKIKIKLLKKSILHISPKREKVVRINRRVKVDF